METIGAAIFELIDHQICEKNIGKKCEKIVYRIWRVCYTRQGVSRFSPCVHISDSPYSGVGHSDRLLICGDYVPTGIPAWETIKTIKEEIKMIS